MPKSLPFLRIALTTVIAAPSRVFAQLQLRMLELGGSNVEGHPRLSAFLIAMLGLKLIVLWAFCALASVLVIGAVGGAFGDNVVGHLRVPQTIDEISYVSLFWYLAVSYLAGVYLAFKKARAIYKRQQEVLSQEKDSGAAVWTSFWPR